jgi:hypothetical protein
VLTMDDGISMVATDMVASLKGIFSITAALLREDRAQTRS